jgi:hypothetical protein
LLGKYWYSDQTLTPAISAPRAVVKRCGLGTKTLSCSLSAESYVKNAALNRGGAGIA